MMKVNIIMAIFAIMSTILSCTFITLAIGLHLITIIYHLDNKLIPISVSFHVFYLHSIKER